MSIQVTAINVAAAKAGREDANACKGWVNNDGSFSITAEPGQNLLVFSNPSWQLADARWAKQGVDVIENQTAQVDLQLVRRTGGWNSVMSEIAAAIASAKGEPAPAPLPPSPQVKFELGDGSDEAVSHGSIDWPDELLPKKPMSEKTLRTMLKPSEVCQIEAKIIDGEEHITSIMLGGCGPIFDREFVGQLIWIEHSLLAHIDKFPHLEALMLTGAVANDDWLKPLRGNRSLRMVGFPYAKQITAASIEHLATLPNLEGIYLMSMHLDPDVVAKIRDFPKLETLQLGGSISHKGLTQLRGNSKLKQLAVMPVAKTDLTDETLGFLASLPNLEGLMFNFQGVEATFTDTGLKQLAELKALKTLVISGKQITDAGLLQLRDLKQLESIELSATSVTDAGAVALKRHLPKVEVKLISDK